ncbi:MAG: FAD-dependent oxidoreductase [Deltaproteobacteria bacterium]|nr:FAD-dependent oxidoreductase [Deltaproteobacteria bacterium]
MIVVIVGGDAAGMSAASQIRRQKPEYRVIVLEKSENVSYGACGMPYNLADNSRDTDDLKVISPENFINKRGIDLRLNHEVVSVTTESVTVKTPDNQYEQPYDKLLIASGARASRPDIENIEGENTWFLHTLGDAEKIKEDLRQNTISGVAIIGGGYTGIEMAESLTALGKSVTLVKRSKKLFPFLPEMMNQRIEDELKRNGVKLEFGKTPVRINRTGKRISIVFEDKTETDADRILVVSGVEPAAEAFISSGIKPGIANSIQTDEFLETSFKNVYAAGDCSDAFCAVTGEKIYEPLALKANRYGKVAAANMMGNPTKAPPVSGASAVRIFSLELAVTGIVKRSSSMTDKMEIVSNMVTVNSRAHAFPGGGKMDVHLLCEKDSGLLLGGAICGPFRESALRIDALTSVIMMKGSIWDLYNMDYIYTPPLGPVWSPLLVAAGDMIKKLK